MGDLPIDYAAFALPMHPRQTPWSNRPSLQKQIGMLLSLALFGLFLYVQHSAGTILVTQAESQITQATYTLSVDARVINHDISPYIYGVNHATKAMGDQLNLPVNRHGGNATSRYNWQTSSTNLGKDWFFLNKAEGTNSGNLPHGSVTDLFVEQNRSTNTDSLLTIPMIGWVSKSRNDACGFSVAKYGAQDQTAQPWDPDCGNGYLVNKSDGSGRITWADPTDASVAVDESFAQDWIAHLKNKYGDADNGGVRFYNMDNEPMLWFATHQDVHPNPVSYDEIRDKTYQYAAAVKMADPASNVIGPTVWGWPAYFYSAVDREDSNSNPDRAAHGDTPFLEWYLQQMAAYEAENSVRILDYLDIHYYPQSTGVTLSPAGDLATQERRLRSTRSLWDPSHIDDSWINQQVYLVPRMHDWVERNYPGTKLSVSEYNFGGLEHINGAVTQADVLGIYGRENLHMALLWGWIDIKVDEPWAYAFRMYRNYDGSKSTFGDLSVPATSSNEWDMAIYAARRSSDGALTIMVVNKSFEAGTAQVDITGLVSSNAAEVYQYSGANLSAIQNLGVQRVGNSQLVREVAEQSITLFVIKDAVYEPAPPPTPEPSATPLPSPTTPVDDPLPGATPAPTVVPPTTPAHRWLLPRSQSQMYDLGWSVIDIPAGAFTQDVFLELDFSDGYANPGDAVSNPFDPDSKTQFSFSITAYGLTNGQAAELGDNKTIEVSLKIDGELLMQIQSGTVGLFAMNPEGSKWENVPMLVRRSSAETLNFQTETLTTWALRTNKNEIFLPFITR